MAENLMRALAANLRRLRRAARPKLSQHALADAAGIHRNTIARIELGEVDAVDTRTLEALMKALGVGLSDLLILPDEAETQRVRESLERFLASPLGVGVTEDERRDLEEAQSPWGPLPEAGWYHLLEAMRAKNRSGQ